MDFICDTCTLPSSKETVKSECSSESTKESAKESNSIILYSTGCPRCVVLSKKLAQSGVKFTVVSDADKMIEMGFQTAPILSVNGKNMQFGDAVRWVNSKIA